MGFDALPILHRTVHALGEGGHEALAPLVLQHLCPIFGDEAGDLKINDLARFETGFAIGVLGRQGRSIHG